MDPPSVAAALALWPCIRDQAGLPEGPWQLRPLKVDERPERSQAVLLAYDGHHQIIFKHQRAPHNPAYVAAMFRNGRDAFEAFDADDRYAIAEPIFHDHDSQSFLVAFVPGQSVEDLLFNGALPRQDLLALTTRVGIWLARYHRARGLSTGPFNGRWHIDYFRTAKDSITARQIDPPAREPLLRLLDRAAEIAEQQNGAPSIRSIQHGDFHSGNILLDGDRLVGIDLTNDRKVPVAMDLGRFAFNHLLMPADLTGTDIEERDTPGPRLLPPPIRRALAQGYDILPADDPLIELALFEHAVSHWMRIPKERARRKKVEQQRLSALRRRCQYL